MVASQGGWVLAVDFGTTFTSAAVVRDGHVELLEVDGLRRFPSCVVQIDGELVVGPAADHQQVLHPGATERNPKRYLGLRDHLLLGEQPVSVVAAVGAVLAAVYQEATRRQGGQAPDRVRLTHPARWSAARLEALRAAATEAGIGDVEFLAEPVAAALHYGGAKIKVGDYVGVYDLGGGTFDTAVLRRTADGFELAGPPGGDERLGGEDFDHRLMDFFLARLAAEEPDAAAALRESNEVEWRRANAQLLTEAKQAKEALSRQTTYSMLLPPPISREMRVTRPEFEALIRADVQSTIDEFRLTIDRAGLDLDQLAARYLTGGSSRIPLVSRLLHETFDEAPDTYDDPKTAVAMGAAEADALYFTAAVVPPPATVDVEPDPDDEQVDDGPPDDTAVTAVTAAAGLSAATLAAPVPGDGPDDDLEAFPPPPPAASEASGDSDVSEVSGDGGREDRTRVLAISAAVLVAVLLAIGGAVAFWPDGDDDDTTLTAGAEEVTTTTAAGPLEKAFEPSVELGMQVERKWKIDGTTFTSEEIVTNTADQPATGFHDVVVPKAIAADASLVMWETPGAEVVQADPIFRFRFENLEPGASQTYRYSVDVAGKQIGADTLEQFSVEFIKDRDAHLAAVTALEQLALAPPEAQPSAPLVLPGVPSLPSAPAPATPTPAAPPVTSEPAPSASISGPSTAKFDAQTFWYATSQSNVSRCQWRVSIFGLDTTQSPCDGIFLEPKNSNFIGCGHVIFLDVWNSAGAKTSYSKTFCINY